MQIPDFFEELSGWRRFNVRGAQHVLVSVNHPTPWLGVDPGEAVCLADTTLIPSQYGQIDAHEESPDCPAQRCSCGFYAYKEKAHALEHSQGTLLALVKLWGRVVEHQRGYRSSRIKIAALHVASDFQFTAALEARYRVPVIADKELDEWTSEKRSEQSQLSQLKFLQGLMRQQNQLAPKAPYVMPSPWFRGSPQYLSGSDLSKAFGNILK